MSSLSDPKVLRLPRTDVANDFVLVNVEPSGSDPLDLKLVATDGQSPFVASVRQNQIQKLQASSSQIQLDHWQSILSAVLLQSIPNDPTLAGVEAVANVSSSQLTITIRNKISGITQRLGVITLDKDEDEDIQLYDWTGFAVSRADGLAHQLATFQSTVAEHQKTIDDLTAQLDDLVKAKKSHQDEMLRKFAALLNTKKLKIRDQQRLLAHSNVDPTTADHVQQVRSGTSSRKPDLSRSSKRKADANIQESETDDDGSEGTGLGNRMDEENDMRQDLDEPLKSDKSDKSDLDTEDDDSDGGFAPAPMPSQPSLSQARSQSSVGAKGKALETFTPNGIKPAPQKSPEIELPPRRQLPFSKRNDLTSASQASSKSSSQTLPQSSATNPSSKPPPAMDDDEETDDEL